MKRIVLLLIGLVAIGCSKQEYKETSYSFVDLFGVVEEAKSREGMEAAYVTFTFFLNEYKGGKCVATHSITSPKTERTYRFVAKEGSEYVTVHSYVKAGPKSAPAIVSYEHHDWFANAYRLTPGLNTSIYLTASTKLSPTEPILD